MKYAYYFELQYQVIIGSSLRVLPKVDNVFIYVADSLRYDSLPESIIERGVFGQDGRTGSRNVHEHASDRDWPVAAP